MATSPAVKAGAPTTEEGYAGLAPPTWNELSAGIVSQSWQDEVPNLQWPWCIPVYHRMRTDAQIDALTRAWMLPLRRYRWSIDPNGARDQTAEEISTDMGLPIRGQVWRPGRTRDRFNHDDHLRHAMLGAIYGNMFFNQVGIIDDDLKWRLRRLAPRMPQSIAQIRTFPNGLLRGIVQWGSAASMAFNDPKAEIKVDVLAPYVWDREGAAWYGRSIYRPLYKHWLLKDRLLRVDAMKHERYGLGIPTGTAPKGANGAIITEYGKLASSVTADPDGGVGLPAGASLSVEGVKGSLTDTLASIQYHDQQMARDFLAMFIQLGQTQSGSRALGKEFIDFFQMSCETLANWYATITNAHVIEDMVDWNYSIDENAPRLVYEMDPTVDQISASDIVQLIQSGGVVIDDGLRQWIRDRWAMPEDVTVDTESSTATPGGTVTPITPAAASHRKRPIGLRSVAASAPPVGHRYPTAVEAASGTDFVQLQQQWETATSTLVEAWRPLQAEQIDAVVAAVLAAAAANDATALANLAAPVLGATLLRDHMMSVTEQAIVAARGEAAIQGVEIPLIDVAELEGIVGARADAIAALMARGLASSAARQALNRYGTDTLAAADVASGVRDHLESLSDAYLNDQLGGALSQAQNTGRRAVISTRPATIYASELLDNNTCSACAAVDGRQYDSVAAADADYPAGGFSECAGAERCRGTLVAIYDEAEASVA